MIAREEARAAAAARADLEDLAAEEFGGRGDAVVELDAEAVRFIDTFERERRFAGRRHVAVVHKRPVANPVAFRQPVVPPAPQLPAQPRKFSSRKTRKRISTAEEGNCVGRRVGSSNFLSKSKRASRKEQLNASRLLSLNT